MAAQHNFYSQYIVHFAPQTESPHCPEECLISMQKYCCQWSFDVSSFMVLVGEAEEFSYRLMQRSLLECLTAAPVAGLQSYIRSNYSLLETTGFLYFSPRGCTTAPLRNMRLTQSISRHRLLRDGACKVYQIPAVRKTRSKINRSSIVAVVSWLVFVAIMAFTCLIGDMSWIGYSACSGLTAWSIIVRLAERYCLEPTTVKASQPDQSDAVYILGRRSSCLVLQGSRRDVSKWTGQGLEQKKGEIVELICLGMRVGSLVLLLYLLVVIPNGTTSDQVVFIFLNTMGQLNVILGQNLNARACFEELELVEDKVMPTRTHVYAYLLRKFGNGRWVDKAGLLPQTEEWTAWRDAVTRNLSMDPKLQYEICTGERSIETTITEKVMDNKRDAEVIAGKVEDIRGKVEEVNLGVI
jgi:hypothetical protein